LGGRHPQITQITQISYLRGETGILAGKNLRNLRNLWMSLKIQIVSLFFSESSPEFARVLFNELEACLTIQFRCCS
jgi:hypothetical protein